MKDLNFNFHLRPLMHQATLAAKKKNRLGCFQIVLYSLRLIVIIIVAGFEILIICFDG